MSSTVRYGWTGLGSARRRTLLRDGEPVGELSRQKRKQGKKGKLPRAGFETGDEQWEFCWGPRRFERTAILAGRTSMVATKTSAWRDRWQFEGDLTCTAVPRRPIFSTVVLRDSGGELGSVAQPLTLRSQVRLQLIRDLPVGQAAFLLWVLEDDVGMRISPLDLLD